MRIYIIFFISFIISSLEAQWNKSSLHLKDQLKYKDAVSKYESQSQSGHKDFEYARTLYKIGEYKKSYIEYFKLHENKDSFSPLDIQYFLTVIKIENPQLHDSISNIYKLKSIYQSKIRSNFSTSKDSSILEKYGFNSEGYEDFGPTLYKNNLIFVSSRPNPLGRLDDYHYNGQPFYDIYMEKNGEILNLNDVDKSLDLPKEINTDLHDGPIYIAENQKMIFVTRNIQSKKSPTLTLGIFYSVKTNNQWSKFMAMPINNENYSVQHPYFNQSTQELYFSSNQNLNHFDIYKIKFNQGVWEKPTVLDQKINTSLDEVFPYMYQSKLYFSSNGFSGKGGFDIYCLQNDSIVAVDDLNSSFDDYGLLFINDSSGYVSSNRFGGFGNDDLIKFSKIKKSEPIKPITKIEKTIAANNPQTVESPSKKDKKTNPKKVKTTSEIAKNTESVLPNNCGDLDQDGILDYKDLDSDNDGLPDKLEGQNDLDKDGIPNYLDVDSDNDGITDIDEGTKDSDNDKKPDFLDFDSDNDGIEDKVESVIDTDGDGIPNYLDLDSDNDGIKDKTEGNKDRDQDGLPNYLDLDSDNDGISDKTEGAKDFDKDGLPNFLDLDSDGDGILDEIENGKFSNPDFADADGDGQPNYLDLDSDMDGIPDKFEKPDCIK